MSNPKQKGSLLACPLCGSTIPQGESPTLWHATAHSASFTREKERQREGGKDGEKKKRERAGDRAGDRGLKYRVNHTDEQRCRR